MAQAVARKEIPPPPPPYAKMSPTVENRFRPHHRQLSLRRRLLFLAKARPSPRLKVAARNTSSATTKAS